MQKIIRIITLVFLGMVLIQSQVSAQQAVLSSGGVATGVGGTVSYSLGIVFYQSYSGTTGSVGSNRDTSINSNVLSDTAEIEAGSSMAEGLQQAYDIDIVSALEETDGIDLSFSAYPNPATDFLILKVENYPYKDLMYQLFDISGNLLNNEKIQSMETFISMSGRVEAIYTLIVTSIHKQSEIKFFKIVKN